MHAPRQRGLHALAALAFAAALAAICAVPLGTGRQFRVAAQIAPANSLSVEFPPAGARAFIQTSGPNGGIENGNWYTVRGPGLGNRSDSFLIRVPCTTLPPTATLSVDLFDPESFRGSGVVTSSDEIVNANKVTTNVNADADSTTFQLFAPNGTAIATATYPPAAATNEQWVRFTTIAYASYGCGDYRLTAVSESNDTNAWRLRVSPADPDGVAGSGDEIVLAAFETTFRHIGRGTVCQSYFFYVAPNTAQIRLDNFDMDGTFSVVYTPPAGGVPITGTVSGATRWNNGGRLIHPKEGGVGGDLIRTPATGWWRADMCVTNTASSNQYIFDPEGPFEFSPTFPQLQLGNDDRRAPLLPGEVLTYTIPYSNVGTAAATGAVLTATLPPELSYLGCGRQPCGHSGTSPGLITYTLGTVPAGSGGSAQLVAQVRPDVISGTLITNAVALAYRDPFNRRYPEQSASGSKLVRAPVLAPDPPALAISKLVMAPPGRDITTTDTLTYTIVLTNTGQTALDVLPLSDVFTPSELIFLQATPAPDTTLPGQLRWSDLTGSFGHDLASGETITITTFFRAVRATISKTIALNEACARDARDVNGSLAPSVCSSTGVTMPAVTAISLAALAAQPDPAGGVRLSWRTSSEVDSYGFAIYQGTERAQAKLVTPQLIVGRGAGSQAGTSYSYHDAAGDAATVYWLVDSDLAGNRSWHGPLRVAAALQDSPALWLPLLIR